MTQKIWYTETYNPTDNKAKGNTAQSHTDFASVRSVIEERTPGEIVRVRAPTDASPVELEQLRDLAARLNLWLELT